MVPRGAPFYFWVHLNTRTCLLLLTPPIASHSFTLSNLFELYWLLYYFGLTLNRVDDILIRDYIGRKAMRVIQRNVVEEQKTLSFQPFWVHVDTGWVVTPIDHALQASQTSLASAKPHDANAARHPSHEELSVCMVRIVPVMRLGPEAMETLLALGDAVRDEILSHHMQQAVSSSSSPQVLEKSLPVAATPSPTPSLPNVNIQTSTSFPHSINYMKIHAPDNIEMSINGLNAL